MLKFNLWRFICGIGLAKWWWCTLTTKNELKHHILCVDVIENITTKQRALSITILNINLMFGYAKKSTPPRVGLEDVVNHGVVSRVKQIRVLKLFRRIAVQAESKSSLMDEIDKRIIELEKGDA